MAEFLGTGMPCVGRDNPVFNCECVQKQHNIKRYFSDLICLSQLPAISFCMGLTGHANPVTSWESETGIQSSSFRYINGNSLRFKGHFLLQ